MPVEVKDGIATRTPVKMYDPADPVPPALWNKQPEVEGFGPLQQMQVLKQILAELQKLNANLAPKKPKVETR